MKWEYISEAYHHEGSDENETSYLNMMGESRWECYQIVEGIDNWKVYYFKRVKDESNIRMC